MKRKEFIELWIKALESGKYKRVEGQLIFKSDNDKKSYCCLGVACVVAAENRIRRLDLDTLENETYLPKTMRNLLGMTEAGGFKEPITARAYGSLAELNDAGWSFKKIAKELRKQLDLGNIERNTR